MTSTSSAPFEYFRLHQHRDGSDPVDIDSPNLRTLTVVAEALLKTHPDDPAPVITGINTVNGQPTDTLIDAALSNLLCAQDDDTAVAFEITYQTRHRVKVPADVADDPDAVDAFIKTAVDTGVGINDRHVDYHPTDPNRNVWRLPVVAIIDNPDPNGQFHIFRASSDDELWEDIKLYFEGEWEDDYASIYDFIEERGLRLF